MKYYQKIKSKFFKTTLKVLGLSSIIFLLEACYGTPATTYIHKKQTNFYAQKNDSINSDLNKNDFSELTENTEK